MMKVLDESTFACGIFTDLQRPLILLITTLSTLSTTKKKKIIMNKTNINSLNQLTDRKQSVSINGFNSDISTVTFGVPEGSVLEPLLSFIYINDLNLAIKHCQIHHFADETGLLNINKSQNVLINSLISTQQNIFKCLKNKTGFLKRKSMDFNLKRKLNGK